MIADNVQIEVEVVGTVFVVMHLSRDFHTHVLGVFSKLELARNQAREFYSKESCYTRGEVSIYPFRVDGERGNCVCRLDGEGWHE